MTEIQHSDLLQCAIEAAHAAGNHAFNNTHRRTEIFQKTAHDVKLQLDLECQRKAEEVIGHIFPDHRILGEEGGAYYEGDEYLWIIDPIDGTVNFTHGLPLWCSSIAVRKGRDMLAGAVFMPAMKELYTASATEVSKCNGEPIHVSDVERLEDAMVLTGLSKHLAKNEITLASFEAVSRRVQKTRLMGAAAVDICHVACGRADAYYESSIHLWDVAAAGLIVQQAGGKAETIEQISEVTMRYLCTNGKLHNAMRDLVRSVLPPINPNAS